MLPKLSDGLEFGDYSKPWLREYLISIETNLLLDLYLWQWSRAATEKKDQIIYSKNSVTYKAQKKPIV